MPTQAAHPEVSPGATAPRACRLRVGVPAKNDAASEPTGHTSWMPAPSARRAHPHPRAGGRGDGNARRARGEGSAKRVMPPNLGSRSNPRRTLRHGRSGRASASEAKCRAGDVSGRAFRPPRIRIQCAIVADGVLSARTRQTVRPPPADTAQITGAACSVRIPIRAPAVAATGYGRRAPETGGAKRVMPPSPTIRIYRPAYLRHARAGCAAASRQRGRQSACLGAGAFRAARIPIRTVCCCRWPPRLPTKKAHEVMINLVHNFPFTEESMQQLPVHVHVVEEIVAVAPRRQGNTIRSPSRRGRP